MRPFFFLFACLLVCSFDSNGDRGAGARELSRLHSLLHGIRVISRRRCDLRCHEQIVIIIYSAQERDGGVLGKTDRQERLGVSACKPATQCRTKERTKNEYIVRGVGEHAMRGK